MNEREAGMSGCTVEIRDVWKTYQLGDTRVDALRGIDLEIDAGEFTVLLGPSGSGKSSLLHLIGAMDRPERGHIRLNGRDILHLSTSAQSDLRLRHIGFVFQTFNLMPTLSALDNVALPMRLAGVRRRIRRERASALLDNVGLADRAAHLPRQLSGGQRQRVAIARAVANKPELILADEPTGNLDTESGKAIMQLLQGANSQGATVVVVTHNPDLIEYAERVVSLRDGQIDSDSACSPAYLDPTEGRQMGPFAPP